MPLKKVVTPVEVTVYWLLTNKQLLHYSDNRLYSYKLTKLLNTEYTSVMSDNMEVQFILKHLLCCI